MPVFPIHLEIMEAIINALSSAKSAEDIETAISSSSTLDLVSSTEDSASGNDLKERLKAVLEKFSDDSEIATTAKLRRRIKRFQQSLDVTVAKSEISVPQDPRERKVVGTTPHLTPDESIVALQACRSYHDLAREMNNLCLPGVEEGGVKGDFFAVHRCPMKNILQSLVAKEGMTNKVLRRRVTRLIFVLSTEAEQAEEVAAVKAKALMAATRNITQKKVREPIVREPIAVPTILTPIAVPALSKFEAARFIADCISSIRSAKTPADVERAISGLPSSGFGDSEILRDLLNTVVENQDLVNNAKLRRRVKRLIETLLSSSDKTEEISTACPPSDTVASQTASTVSTAPSSSGGRVGGQSVQKAQQQQPLRIPSVVVAAVPLPPLPEVRVITGSFESSMQLLLTATTSTEVEAAISDLSADSEGDTAAREAVCAKLAEIFENEQLINNSKLRRRVKRLVEVLAPPPLIVATAPCEASTTADVIPSSASIKKKSVKVKKEDLKNPPSGPSIDALVLEAFAAGTSEQLSTILDTVTAESGTCSSRRTLKRFLERVLKNESALSGDITAQSRRKFRRIADTLAPRPAVVLIPIAAAVVEKEM